MTRDRADWFALTDAFMSAALGVGRWEPALARLADVTGSRAGQLIGVMPDGTLAFNLFTGLDPSIHAEYVAARRTDPTINPRMQAGKSARLLQAVAEVDFLTEHEHANSIHYREFARPWDIPYSCLAPVSRDEGSNVVLAVFRSERQGHIGRVERARFQALTPHVHGALRMQRALADQGASLAAGMLDAISLAAFVCDADGRVRGITHAAEAVAEAGDFLQVRDGVLRAAAAPAAAALAAAMRRAGSPNTQPGPPASGALLIRGRRDAAAMIAIDVFRLPAGTVALPFRPRVLVVVRGARRRRGDLAELLQHACGLTEAEAEVALAIADGMDLEAVARTRRVGVATVRSQVKSVYSKLGVRRQAELAARLQSLR